MFTILSSLAQEESRNISENTAWGIRSKFQRGIPHLNTEALLGYDKDADGNLVIRTSGSSTDDRFYSRVFCAACGGKYVRKNWKGNRAVFWKCENAEKKKGNTCSAENVREAALQQAVVIAWNSLVERRNELLPRWERQSVEGDALQRYRARMMLAMTEDGPLDDEIPELTRMMLEEIPVHGPNDLTVRFLDGSERNVRI